MRVYFVGICGAAMGQAALLLRARGAVVEGSDRGVYPPMSDLLIAAGVPVHEGFSAERLEGFGADLVVVGNATTRGNPEVEWLLDTRTVRFVSLPQLLREEVMGQRPNLVITGTHGKTTTAAMAAHLLRAWGVDPGWFIGGVPRDLPGGSRLGGAKAPFVLEGDEYDSAFFDKRSKFIHYAPRVALLNNLEFDHGDIFRDLDDVQRSFRHFLRLVPRRGHIVANGDEENLAVLLEEVTWAPVLRVGTGEGNDLRLAAFAETPEGTRTTLHWQGRELGELRLGVPGLYNARNAACALLGASLVSGRALSLDDAAPLESFGGVRRRQEVRLEREDLLVLEDFAHHPTALAAVLESLRARYPAHTLHACFEPRSNTSCRALFQMEFAAALEAAHRVYLAPVHRAETIPVSDRLDTARLASDLASHGTPAEAFVAHEDLLAELQAALRRTKGPQLVVFLSNGGFGGIIGRFVEEA